MNSIWKKISLWTNPVVSAVFLSSWKYFTVHEVLHFVETSVHSFIECKSAIFSKYPFPSFKALGQKKQITYSQKSGEIHTASRSRLKYFEMNRQNWILLNCVSVAI